MRYYASAFLRWSEVVAEHIHFLQRMRDFYEIFPYPNRNVLLEPDVRGALLAHAGFAHSLASSQELCEQIVDSVTLNCSPKENTKYIIKLNTLTQKDFRILSVGCGTDEPLLLRKLHPTADLTAIDLSARSVRRAKIKVFLFRLKSLLRFKLLPSVQWVIGDAARFLENNTGETFDHIQCFGVLHHQSDARRLFANMASALKERGTLRLMIYSHKGRRLERRIQKRNTLDWSVKPRFFALRLRLLNFKLFFWQLVNFLFPFMKGHLRFRYLGLNRAMVADAFMHPSDPGLPLANVLAWSKELGLRLVYCEAKTDDGWVRAVKSADVHAQDIAARDEREGLLSNFTCILQKS